jgi:hypothetical protein
MISNLAVSFAKKQNMGKPALDVASIVWLTAWVVLAR